MVDRLVHSEANSRRIAYVEQCFGASGQPLNVTGRALVGEGVLTKMCRKKPKPRQFFLFNDILVYGNIVINRKKYNQQHVISLEDVKLEDVQDEGTLRNGWKLISPSKSFVVYAATSTEKHQWMSHIKKCVDDLLIKQGKTQNTDNDSPVWVPDSEATLCMHCKKSQFTLINRRHHCRKCGIVVCKDCSSNKWLLPQQASKPLRVCLTCYQGLSHTKATVPVTNTHATDDSSGDSSSDDDEEPANQDVNEENSIPPEGQFQSYE
ncbi:pleckstrin homology domain-containing family F member 2-like isoform X4 [Crassostrea angulata]|uniref:Pleckstrin-like protein domain-containing family F member 2 n=1 Tax=Magallana gigas TaxID=29159 RepID=A0A8W8NAN5_MAGGI|nr:pleckstrin homology domain-containing family F member 2 isoform X4 [Crassostrea gigas]XP_052678720.1 pleckstrin homology domain-containing family F member 2-like isoform X4 [Crassostrea angulata]|eukprot:XP_011444013.1 PREDICTED: pleckstrin homology domain-containing family F member 2 isoform X4 [Crassostrea gigas]